MQFPPRYEHVDEISHGLNQSSIASNSCCFLMGDFRWMSPDGYASRPGDW